MRMNLWYLPLLSTVLAAVSGVLLALSLPPSGVSILGWVALLPLLVASILMRRLLFAALCGLVTSAAAAIFLAGTNLTPSQIGNLTGAFGSLGIVFAAAAILAQFGYWRLHSALWPFYAAAAGVAAELLGSTLFPVYVAISQYQTPGALRLSSYTGVWGVTFLLWLVPASLIALIASPRRSWPSAALAVAAVTAVLLTGSTPDSGGRRVATAAVQAPDGWAAANVTRELGRDVKLVVWPEHLMASVRRMPYEVAAETGKHVVASYVRVVRAEKPLNTAVLISPDGRPIGTCAKRRLFGRESLDYSRGTNACTAMCDGVRVGLAICFDTVFTDVTRDLARRGARIVLVPNSDPEMPNLLFNHLHAAIVAFRAAENGIPIVWSESHGLSAIYGASGTIVARAPGHAVTSAQANVPIRTRTTLYTRIGDSFAYACAAFALTTAGLGALSPIRRKNKRNISGAVSS